VIGDILQPTHLIFILLVALIFLGPKRLPEAGKALGKGLRDFRGAVSGLEESIQPSPPEQSPVQTTPAVATAQSSPTTTAVEPATVTATVQSPPSFEGESVASAPAVTPAPAMEFDMSTVVSPDAVTNPVTDTSASTTSFAARTRGATDAPVVPQRPATVTEPRAARAEVDVADPTEYAD